MDECHRISGVKTLGQFHQLPGIEPDGLLLIPVVRSGSDVGSVVGSMGRSKLKKRAAVFDLYPRTDHQGSSFLRVSQVDP